MQRETLQQAGLRIYRFHDRFTELGKRKQNRYIFLNQVDFCIPLELAVANHSGIPWQFFCELHTTSKV